MKYLAPKIEIKELEVDEILASGEVIEPEEKPTKPSTPETEDDEF